MRFIARKNMRILGIETSCDETGIAIYDSEKGLLSHALHSQASMHNRYGGVVPELASRDHIQHVLPLIDEVLLKANLSLRHIDGIAYTEGPGLIGAILVGATIGKTLGYALKIPAIGIHHLEGHLLSVFLENEKPEFPFVALLASGGHTALFQVDAFGKYLLLGESLDDAAGEAFDKTAKLLGLPYPGGAALEALAQKGKLNKKRFLCPRPMREGLNFSFSGLKTFVARMISKCDSFDEQTKADIAYAFQDAIVDTLILKCKKAIETTKLATLVIAGGVSANQKLRLKIQEEMQKLGVSVYQPRLSFCTDNGAMIAYAGYLHLLADNSIMQKIDLTIKAYARLDLSSIATLK